MRQAAGPHEQYIHISVVPQVLNWCFYLWRIWQPSDGECPCTCHRGQRSMRGNARAY